MGTESIDVVWPEVCLGCGEKRISMKDASYKWRSTLPVGSEIRYVGTMISFKVGVHLCEECAEESRLLRKANTSWALTIWLMKFFFILLIPAIIIIISTDLDNYIPGFEYAHIIVILAIVYPYFAVFVTFHDAVMMYLTRSTQASAYITINPPTTGRNSILFAFRNENYTAVFREQNPELKASYSPSVGGYIEYPKKFPKNKAIAFVSPSLIALALFLLAVMG
ncbi:MAG: hypothetical protein RTU63_02235 [Candidatus Thorarchaeota archaeon]